MATAPTSVQFNLDQDIRAAVEMAAALTPYIYEDELYGALAGSLPRLTVGGLLMRLHRLGALRSLLSLAQQAALDKAQRQFDTVRKDWAVAYEGKLEREMTARLRSLGEFLRDCTADPRNCAEAYPAEIEKRVIAGHLQAELQARGRLSQAFEGGLKAFDASIKRLVRPGDFIWDPRLKLAYPQDLFDYLYVNTAPPKNT